MYLEDHRARRSTLVVCCLTLLCIRCSETNTAAVPDGAGSHDLGRPEGGADLPRDSLDIERCAPTAKPAPGTVITEMIAVIGTPAGQTWSFKGIPYATPPVGPLRWQAPRPASCMTEPLVADTYGPACPQLSQEGIYSGEEDCLTLNVWSPQQPAGGSGRPVMVFIHGGGNIQGSSGARNTDGSPFYDGQALAERAGAVVVTLNYRLGALGLLTHTALSEEGSMGTSGNYSLLDQIEALSWVQRNIGAFGGDPGRVLLFGESAGAVNTCLLLVSPLAAGLFSAALMESGGCWARSRGESEAFGAEFAGAAGCADADPRACLRGLPAEALVRTLPGKIDLVGDPLEYQPHVDGWVIPGEPLELLGAGEHNRVPLIVGSNSHETSLSVPGITTAAAYTSAVHALAGETALAASILEQYPVNQYSTPRQAYIALTTDLVFTCSARRVARAAAAGQGAPVYRYFFSRGLQNAGPFTTELGAFHALELAFVFSFLGANGYAPLPAEIALSEAMIGYWGSFAAAGVPEAPGAPAWPPYEAAADPFLEFADPITAGAGLRTAQCDFWDSQLP